MIMQLFKIFQCICRVKHLHDDISNHKHIIILLFIASIAQEIRQSLAFRSDRVVHFWIAGNIILICWISLLDSIDYLTYGVEQLFTISLLIKPYTMNVRLKSNKKRYF